jgi:diguanylate cyclase (GGDEF)-like protein
MEIASAVLERLEIAVLKRTAPLCYELMSDAPRFYREQFRDGDTVSLTPWNTSAMLELFITDAEAFFDRGLEGEIRSDIWREDGVDEGKAFQATAMIVRGEALLILRSLDEEHMDRVRILQKARDQLLQQRALRMDLAKYKDKAEHDPLTGLSTRAVLMDTLNEAVAGADATGGTFSLLMLDIDDFKHVNDSYGHLAGDDVLRRLGQILTRHLRGGDMAARYGGEEFVVLAANTPKEQAFLMAENLRGRVAEHNFQLPRPVTVSIGCTAYEHGEDIYAVIQRADFALYEAKRKTKNMVVVR